jgi:hypothetical protein
MKKHGDFTSVFHYLKTFHRKLREVSSPYEKLSRRSLYEWFTPKGELKPHVKVVEKRTTSTVVEKHFSILKRKPKLKYELITLLKNMCVLDKVFLHPLYNQSLEGSLKV